MSSKTNNYLMITPATTWILVLYTQAHIICSFPTEKVDTTDLKVTDAANTDISSSTNKCSAANAMTDKASTIAKLREIINSYAPTDDKSADSTRAMATSSEVTNPRQVFTDPSNPSVSYTDVDVQDYSFHGRPPHRPPHRPTYVPSGGGGFGSPTITPLPALPLNPGLPPFVELVPVNNPGPDPGTHDNFKSNDTSDERSGESSEEDTGNGAETKEVDDPSATDSGSISKEKRKRKKKYGIKETKKASAGTTPSASGTESVIAKLERFGGVDNEEEQGRAPTYHTKPPKQEIKYSKHYTNLTLLDVFGRDINIKINRTDENTSRVCFRATESNKPPTNVTEKCVIFQRRGQGTSQSEIATSEALKVEGSTTTGSVFNASAPDASADGKTNKTETSTTVARESAATEPEKGTEAEANHSTTERMVTKNEERTPEAKRNDEAPEISTFGTTAAAATEPIDKKIDTYRDISDDRFEKGSTEKLASENSTTDELNKGDGTDTSERAPKDEFEEKTESYKQLEDIRVENAKETNGNDGDVKELMKQLVDLQSAISNHSWTDGNATDAENEGNSTKRSFTNSEDNEEADALPEAREANDESRSENLTERAEDSTTTLRNEKIQDSRTDSNVTDAKNEENSTTPLSTKSEDNEEADALPEARDASDEPRSEKLAERAEDSTTKRSNEKIQDSRKTVKLSPKLMLELLSTITGQERQPPPPPSHYIYYTGEAIPPPPLVLPYEYDAYSVPSNGRMGPDYVEYPEFPLPYFPNYGK